MVHPKWLTKPTIYIVNRWAPTFAGIMKKRKKEPLMIKKNLVRNGHLVY